jgi:hypothetical protein
LGGLGQGGGGIGHGRIVTGGSGRRRTLATGWRRLTGLRGTTSGRLLTGLGRLRGAGLGLAGLRLTGLRLTGLRRLLALLRRLLLLLGVGQRIGHIVLRLLKSVGGLRELVGIGWLLRRLLRGLLGLLLRLGEILRGGLLGGLSLGLLLRRLIGSGGRCRERLLGGLHLVGRVGEGLGGGQVERLRLLLHLLRLSLKLGLGLRGGVGGLLLGGGIGRVRIVRLGERLRRLLGELLLGLLGLLNLLLQILEFRHRILGRVVGGFLGGGDVGF